MDAWIIACLISSSVLADFVVSPNATIAKANAMTDKRIAHFTVFMIVGNCTANLLVLVEQPAHEIRFLKDPIPYLVSHSSIFGVARLTTHFSDSSDHCPV